MFQLGDVRREGLFDGCAVGSQNVAPHFERAERQPRGVGQSGSRYRQMIARLLGYRRRQRG